MQYMLQHNLKQAVYDWKEKKKEWAKIPPK